MGGITGPPPKPAPELLLIPAETLSAVLHAMHDEDADLNWMAPVDRNEGTPVTLTAADGGSRLMYTGVPEELPVYLEVPLTDNVRHVDTIDVLPMMPYPQVRMFVRKRLDQCAYVEGYTVCRKQIHNRPFSIPRLMPNWSTPVRVRIPWTHPLDPPPVIRLMHSRCGCVKRETLEIKRLESSLRAVQIEVAPVYEVRMKSISAGASVANEETGGQIQTHRYFKREPGKLDWNGMNLAIHYWEMEFC